MVFASVATLLLPAPQDAPEGVELRALEGGGFALAEELPDLDQMREAYRAALRLSRRPAHLKDMEALDARLAEETGLGSTRCHIALLALMDMKLVELRERPFGLLLPPMKKTDPESSALWRAIGRLRENDGGRGLT